jgi:hypothetical protein
MPRRSNRHLKRSLCALLLSHHLPWRCHVHRWCSNTPSCATRPLSGCMTGWRRRCCRRCCTQARACPCRLPWLLLAWAADSACSCNWCARPSSSRPARAQVCVGACRGGGGRAHGGHTVCIACAPVPLCLRHRGLVHPTLLTGPLLLQQLPAEVAARQAGRTTASAPSPDNWLLQLLPPPSQHWTAADAGRLCVLVFGPCHQGGTGRGVDTMCAAARECPPVSHRHWL